ncbi:D-hexose-6-phosphate mutarotase, partial [bacterium]|nr:D-hexose-6-phosphate mutarotase [bacterium]
VAGGRARRSMLVLLAALGLNVGVPLRTPSRSASVSMVAAPAPAKEANALKSLTLSNAAGDSATVYQFGACVTSYVKGGTDYLMVRPDAKMDGSKPISGGIPHCFPQFGPGAIQQHGFARNLDWDILEQSAESVVFGLSENEYTLAMWPYKFTATYTVSLKADKLATELCVTNTDSKRWDFTAALHSYWSVSGISNVKVTSADFNGAKYLDKTLSPPAEVSSSSDAITITKETDSVYAGVAGDVVLSDAERPAPLTISNVLGWSDTVVWSPFGDEGMGFDSFICVESAQASAPVVLGPGEYWTGAMDVVP